MADLRELLGSAKCVLFDFDGPICRLFSGRPADSVAERLRGWLTSIGEEALLSTHARTTRNPDEIVDDVARAAPGSAVAAALEERLTWEEKQAAKTAEPTPHADAVVHALAEAGIKLAVTTNNAPRTVRRYLTRRQLEHYFGPHIYGRDHHATRLKPDPYLLTRALEGTGTAASEAMMIGDAVSDLHAAKNAGVPFVGYAGRAEKLITLRTAGADPVITDLYPMLLAARALGRTGQG